MSVGRCFLDITMIDWDKLLTRFVCSGYFFLTVIFHFGKHLTFVKGIIEATPVLKINWKTYCTKHTLYRSFYQSCGVRTECMHSVYYQYSRINWIYRSIALNNCDHGSSLHGLYADLGTALFYHELFFHHRQALFPSEFSVTIYLLAPCQPF